MLTKLQLYTILLFWVEAIFSLVLLDYNARTHIEKSNTKSVYNKNTEYTVTRQLDEIQVGKLIHAVKSRHPIGIANVINKRNVQQLSQLLKN